MLLVGVDRVEIKRVKKAMENPRFCKMVLGSDEYLQLASRGFPAESVAASFCAKEAFSKAFGTGIRGFSLCEVELLRRENGRPYLKLSGMAAKLAEEVGHDFAVSVTHTKEYAQAVVIAEGNGKTLL